MLLWPWSRPEAAAPILPLAWELLHAAGVALKSIKKKTWGMEPVMEDEVVSPELTDHREVVSVVTDPPIQHCPLQEAAMLKSPCPTSAGLSPLPAQRQVPIALAGG